MSSTIKIAKKSAFQRSVLNLYAQFVRLSKIKPGLLDKVRIEFKKNAKLPKEDTIYLESKLRRARYQLDMLKTSNVTFVKHVEILDVNNKKK